MSDPAMVFNVSMQDAPDQTAAAAADSERVDQFHVQRWLWTENLLQFIASVCT